MFDSELQDWQIQGSKKREVEVFRIMSNVKVTVFLGAIIEAKSALYWNRICSVFLSWYNEFCVDTTRGRARIGVWKICILTSRFSDTVAITMRGMGVKEGNHSNRPASLPFEPFLFICSPFALAKLWLSRGCAATAASAAGEQNRAV